jgi:hypothetical protein
MRLDDDLLEFPGLEVLGENAVDDLVEGALVFIGEEHDHRDELLGTDKYDSAPGPAISYSRCSPSRSHRRRAGHGVGLVGRRSDLVLRPANTGDKELKTKLLEHAARGHGPSLAEAARTNPASISDTLVSV